MYLKSQRQSWSQISYDLVASSLERDYSGERPNQAVSASKASKRVTPSVTKTKARLLKWTKHHRPFLPKISPLVKGPRNDIILEKF